MNLNCVYNDSTYQYLLEQGLMGCKGGGGRAVLYCMGAVAASGGMGYGSSQLHSEENCLSHSSMDICHTEWNPHC